MCVFLFVCLFVFVRVFLKKNVLKNISSRQIYAKLHSMQNVYCKNSIRAAAFEILAMNYFNYIVFHLRLICGSA